jgi:hypothetical protein
VYGCISAEESVDTAVCRADLYNFQTSGRDDMCYASGLSEYIENVTVLSWLVLSRVVASEFTFEMLSSGLGFDVGWFGARRRNKWCRINVGQ